MASGSRHRGGDLFLVPALAANAGAGSLAALRHALRQEGRAALRADLLRHLVGGLLAAAQVLGVLAVGVAGARHELAEAPPLLEDWLAALRALLARVLSNLVVRHAGLRLADVLVELLVEFPD